MHILQITASLLVIFPFMTDIPKLSTHRLSAGENSMARLVALSAIVAVFSFESFLACYIANIHTFDIVALGKFFDFFVIMCKCKNDQRYP